MAGVEGTLCCCHQNPERLCQWTRAGSDPPELGHRPTLLLLSAPMATPGWQEYRYLHRTEAKMVRRNVGHLYKYQRVGHSLVKKR